MPTFVTASARGTIAGMRSFLSLAVVSMLAACGGGNDTRYFRVLFPAAGTGANALPDSCYQAPTVVGPMTADEAAAENYCRVGKKPTSSGSMSNLVTSQAWTLVDTGDSKLFLVISSGGAGTATGAEGVLNNGTYSFTGTTSSFSKQCPTTTTGVVECNGGCVNTRSDAANCGACGDPCPAGMACRLGNCIAMCPSIMQTCGGVTTNTQNDPNNCGFCGNTCAGGQVCSGGNCVAPCAATCSDTYSAADCGTPREFSRTSESKIEFTVQGGALAGTVGTTTAYACTPPGCAADFAARCPTCATSQSIVGRELSNVTEFEQR